MPRTASHLDASGRHLTLGVMLASGKTITTALIRERFSVSHATAKRDMVAIESALPVDAVVRCTATELTLRPQQER